jgi:DNA invertase Pin-like site-specific DNA recombinase
LGIEAQRAALANFAEAQGFQIISEMIEIETGKGSDALDRRPQLAAALASARCHRCSVAVAKLDRLSRDVHFISGLMATECRSWSRSLVLTLIRSSCGCSLPWLRRNAH